MKKLMIILLGISLNLFAGSDIIVGQSNSNSKIKKALTSTPAKVIYALIGIGTASAIGWIIYQARCHRNVSNYECVDESDKNAGLYDESQDAWVQESLTNVDWNGYELNQLFKKSGQDIKNYFFPDQNIVYSTDSQMAYKHNFSLIYYLDDNTQLMRLLDALNNYNTYRSLQQLPPINIYSYKNPSHKITTVSFNPPS